MAQVERSAVVTGAGAGIGRGIADRLIADGWFVVGVELAAGYAADAAGAWGDRGAVVDGDPCDSQDDCVSGTCTWLPFEADADLSVCSHGCSVDADCAGALDGLTCSTGQYNICMPGCTGAVDSDAADVEAVIVEVAASRLTERGATRADDRLSEAAMEDRKRQGYF